MNKFLKLFSILIIIIIFSVGCNNGSGEKDIDFANKQPEKAELFAMDTYMNISAYDISKEDLDDICDEIKKLDSMWSVADENSEIYKINKEGTGKISKETENLLRGALDICASTNGDLDISIYPVVKEWGFTTGEYKVPSKEKIEELLQDVDYKKIKINNNYADETVVELESGMEIDSGSVGKGYTGDLIISMLKEKGSSSALLDLGGNIHALGTKPDGSPWKIGIKDPEGDSYFATIDIEDKAVITSGGYERFFEDDDGNVWWHIIDPKTGFSAKNGLISVTIISNNGLYCDGLSTALFVKGKDGAIDFWEEHHDFDMILITDNNEAFITEGIENSFDLAENSEYKSYEVLQLSDDDK